MHEDGSTLDAFGVAWRLSATLFFVLLNGFFVAAEFALVKVRTARIQELARRKRPAAGMVQHILSRLDLYLSGCQLGITLASLALGALGEPAVSRLLLALADSAGLTIDRDSLWVPVVSIGLAFAIITFLHMTVGEQAPKMLALRRAEATSLRTAFALRAFTFVFRPFIALINGVSNWMLRAAGLPAGAHGEPVPTVEELRSILAVSASAGHITEQEHEIAQKVFRLTALEVRHIMVPRVDVEFLSLETPLESSLEKIRASGHSRFPLCDTDLDTIVGFVHGKDVLAKVLAGEEIALRELAHEPLLVPDTMSLSDLLLQMQQERSHLAAVVDEHGTVIGAAFREDALEEIVGPLGDEFDEEPPDLRETEKGRWQIQGSMPFPALCEHLHVEVDDEGEETVAGWVVAALGRFPRKGDVVSLADYELEVDEIARRRIATVVIRGKPGVPTGEKPSS